jgi:predicted ArsR family transcriptional regulator
MVASVDGTRLKILNLLQRLGQATVDSLARSMGLAPATVRRHLDILQRDQLVTFVEVHKRTGRPEYSYYLTPLGQESLPKGYDRLLALLLEELASLDVAGIGDRSGREVMRLLVDRVASRVVSQYQRPGASAEERLNALTSLLVQQEFAPELERVENVVRVKLHNCPFRTVALAEGDVCGMDRTIISAFVNGPVEKERCISTGAHSCSYVARLVP